MGMLQDTQAGTERAISSHLGADEPHFFRIVVSRMILRELEDWLLPKHEHMLIRLSSALPPFHAAMPCWL